MGKVGEKKYKKTGVLTICLIVIGLCMRFLFQSSLLLIMHVIMILFSGVYFYILMDSKKKERNRLYELAYVDPVTKGYNRARFEREAIERIQKEKQGRFAVVAADISDFKLMNDAFGIEMGNRILKYIYDMMSEQLKEKELAARISEDMFCMLIQNEASENIVFRLHALVNQINRFNDNCAQKYYISLTFGIAKVTDKTRDMIYLEDCASVARKHGEQRYLPYSSTYAFYRKKERLRMIREKDMDNRMLEALEKGEFVVYLQPKIRLDTEELTGAEALVRWNDPKKGMISPGQFIPLFEKNGFIIHLDLYVFEQVCKLMRRWLDCGEEPLPISVNLSKEHLKCNDFLYDYIQICKAYEIPANLIELEITESIVVENKFRFMHLIEELHEIGFRCSLDDFGSGYSSLNLLKDFKADALKIDREFFAVASEDNSRAKNVVESIVELSKKLHMTTVAEGVERPDVLQFLKEIHCDIVQGYIYYKPMSMEEFYKLKQEYEKDLLTISVE